MKKTCTRSWAERILFVIVGESNCAHRFGKSLGQDLSLHHYANPNTLMMYTFLFGWIVQTNKYFKTSMNKKDILFPDDCTGY